MTPQQVTGERFYRVQADWLGGGFRFTLSFPNSEAAAAWGVKKAGRRPDARITVVDRGPVPAIQPAL